MILPPIRQQDSQGAGWFGAPRGNRTHNGVDLCAFPGSLVLSLTTGVVTKIGYPYNPQDARRGHLRYVEVTLDGNRFRYFYVAPKVRVGQSVQRETVLGTVQDLGVVYPGITSHYHFEIIDPSGAFKNPCRIFPEIQEVTT